MKEIIFSFLSEKELPELHQTFLAAFADYLVPIQLTWPQFQSKAKREGVVPAFCAAAYAGEEMVGFILIGLGEWQGKPTAYNAGTGVVPAYRGKKLTQQLYDFLLPKLKQSGIEQCLLEVMQENAPALRSYKNVGFTVNRSLDVFRALKTDLVIGKTATGEVQVKAAVNTDWQTYESFWDAAPSWQNTQRAIKQCPDAHILLEAIDQKQEKVGYIVFFPHNGAILQIAVSPEHRGKGIGNLLLREAVIRCEAAGIMLINVDVAASSLTSFLKQRHFTRMFGQYEMQMSL